MDRLKNDGNNQNQVEDISDHDHEGREQYEMDIDRMVNEGLGGGYVSDQNGYIGDTSVDHM